MTLTVNPRPLGFVVIDGWEYAVRTSDPRPVPTPTRPIPQEKPC